MEKNIKRRFRWLVPVVMGLIVLQVCHHSASVTRDNFPRAETHWHMRQFVEEGAFGKFYHYRGLGITDQPGMRPNVDAYHSVGVFDLDAGPVTIILPDPGERFFSMNIIDEENHTVAMVNAPGEYVYSRQVVGTRYMLAIVRFFVDGPPEVDSQIVHGLQDAIVVKQASVGHIELIHWDKGSQARLRERLSALAASLPDMRRAAGRKEQVDPEKHLIATAVDWGMPGSDEALFLQRIPVPDDGSGVFQLHLSESPACGFWSVSVVDSLGNIPSGNNELYTINNATAHRGADGSITIQFGDCRGVAVNCLAIFPGWRYVVRLYQPLPVWQDSSQAFPAIVPVK
jgi:hypothetical protein